jgi:hypothetical protein
VTRKRKNHGVDDAKRMPRAIGFRNERWSLAVHDGCGPPVRQDDRHRIGIHGTRGIGMNVRAINSRHD